MATPESGKSWRVMETEEAVLLVLPADHVSVFGFLEDFEEELPQLGRGWYVFDLAWVHRGRRFGFSGTFLG